MVMLAALLLAAAPAWGQGLSIPGLGGSGGGAADALRGALGKQTPEQKRAFCTRVGNAALGCGTKEMGALSRCLIKTLPPQDSARVARMANSSRGNVSGLMQECGLTLGR